MKESKWAYRLLVITMCVALSGCTNEKTGYLESGRQNLAEADYEKAQSAFENALKIAPDDTESRYFLAEALSKQGKIEQAFRQYQAVIKQDPHHIMARVRAGQIYLLSGQIDEARELSREALSIAPDNVEAWVLEAGINAANNHTDLAIINVEKALKLDPYASSAILMQASILEKTGNTQQAVARLKKSMDKDPGNASTHLMLANLYLKHGLNAEAEIELNKLVSVNPDSLINYQRLALFYSAENQLDKAEAMLRMAVDHFGDETAMLALVDFLATNRNVDIAMAELLPKIMGKSAEASLHFKMAELQLKKQDGDAAEKTLKEIIENEYSLPVISKARMALARLYVSGKREDQAKKLIAQILAEDAENPDALILKGQFELNEARVKDAIADFRKVLGKQPDNVTVLKLLAAAHQHDRNGFLAAENLEKVLIRNPNDSETRLKLVNVLIQSERLSEAEQHLALLLKQDSAHLDALEALFKIRVLQKDWDKAQQITQLIGRKTGRKASGFFLSGLAYQSAGKIEKSIEAFKQALTIRPDAVEPLTQLIKSYMVLDQNKKAISFLKQQVKKNKDSFVAYNLLGEVYLRAHQFKAAKKAFRQVIKLKPEWSVSYRNLAKLSLRKHEKSAAIDVLRDGIEKTAGAVDLINDLAGVYHRDGQHKKVIDLYEQYYQQSSNSLSALNRLVRYISEYDQTPEALAHAAKLVAPLEKSNTPALMDTLAWLAYKRGSYQKAQKILERIVASGSADAEINYHLGMVYFKQGKNEPAKNYISKAVLSSDHFVGIDQARDVLKKIKSS